MQKGENEAENFIQKVLVAEDSNLPRLDVFVTSHFQKIPRTKIQQAIASGEIKLNDQVVKPSQKVKQNDRVIVRIATQTKLKTIRPQTEIKIEIVEKNKDFIVINKPLGISVHPNDHEHENTVVNWALAYYPQIRDVGESSFRPGIVHRLDKDTSGLLIIALNQNSFVFFKKLFATRKIEKTYQALCWGLFAKKEGQIQTLIGKSKANPTKQATSANPGKLINPKESLTIYRLLDKGNQMSLVEAMPITGRKHQIRIHLQSISHPIVGDKLYCTKDFDQKNMQHERLMLHCKKLVFEYKDGKKFVLSSQPPLNFKISNQS